MKSGTPESPPPWQPRLLSYAEAASLDPKSVYSVHDEIARQLRELIDTRSPASKLTREELAEQVAALGPLDDYGSWVFYPWSGRLVHVLPRTEFLELRTSRNRNKITIAEQQRLSRLKIGIVGLSVGQATALVLALEGIGGTLRLADFDELDLSNTNRLRAGVHEIGVNKAVITARAIFEINPYLSVEVFERGIVDENIDSFLDALNLVIEECDDFKVKFVLRQAAKARRIPVLMETSDRGMLDIERFDLEPARPIFHGLTGDIDTALLGKLTAEEKVPIGLEVVGIKTISPRMAASLFDIGTTLKTWPQLASSVSLGAALNADAARRIALGQLDISGRFFVDLEELIGGHKPTPAADAVPPPAPVIPTHTRSSDSITGPLTRAQLDQIVEWAALAPSGGNCQPWHFVYDQMHGTLESWHVPERSNSFLDFQDRATNLAFGAMAENIRLASLALGVSSSTRVFPTPNSRLKCVTSFLSSPEDQNESTPDDSVLQQWVTRRCSNRRHGVRSELSEDLGKELSAIANATGSKVHFLTDAEELAAFGQIHGESERLRVLHPQMYEDMVHEIRWSREDALSTRDGIELDTLEVRAADVAALRLLRRKEVVNVMRELDVGHGLRTGSIKAMAGASAVGVITRPADTPLDFFLAGRAVQRIWLFANAKGLAFQPVTAMLYVVHRIDDAALTLEEPFQSSFRKIRTELASLVKLGDDVPVFAFRLTQAEPPSARSLRRDVKDVLDVR